MKCFISVELIRDPVSLVGLAVSLLKLVLRIILFWVSKPGIDLRALNELLFAVILALDIGLGTTEINGWAENSHMKLFVICWTLLVSVFDAVKVAWMLAVKNKFVNIALKFSLDMFKALWSFRKAFVIKGWKCTVKDQFVEPVTFEDLPAAAYKYFDIKIDKSVWQKYS